MEFLMKNILQIYKKREKLEENFSLDFSSMSVRLNLTFQEAKSICNILGIKNTDLKL